VLPSLVEQYEAVRADAAALTRGLSGAQFNWRPGADRWSIGQNIAHLNIAARLGFPYLDAMLDRARAAGARSAGPYKRTFIGRLFVWVIEPPYRVRVKTQPMHVPAADCALNDELALFERNQAGYVQRVRAGNGLDLGSVKENLNLLAGRSTGRPANLTLYEWFLFIVAHQRRHLWQARQVRDNPAFPGS
jgi:hypothetical protein